MAIRNDYSQNRKLYVGNGTEVSVSDGNAIITGNVGIGTTGPSEKLQVHSANAKITANSTADSQTVGFEARYLNHSTLKGTFHYTTGNARLWIDNHFTGNNGNYSDIIFRNKNVGGDQLLKERLIIKGSTGNVGIGTTSPSSKLSVAGDVVLGEGMNRYVSYDSGGGNFRITPNNGGWATGYFFNNQSGGFLGGFGALGGSNDSFSYFWIGDDYNDTSMVIKPNNGNVGIGTTTPEVKLDVVGTLRSYASSANYGQIENGSFQALGDHGGTFMLDLDNTGTADLVNIKKSGSSRFYIKNNGNVGIGNTNPGNKLVVDTAQGTTFSEAFLALKASTVTDTVGRTAISLATSPVNNYGVTLNGIRQGSSSGEPRFGIKMHNNSSGGTEALSIRTSGNVGIGTTNPQSKLEVQGSAPFIYITDDTETESGIIFRDLQAANMSQAAAIKFSSADNKFRFYNNDAVAERMVIDVIGNVGIGETAPTNKLHVGGSIKWEGASTEGILSGSETELTIAAQGSVPLIVSANGSEAIMLDPNDLIYKLGDYDGDNNNSYLEIDDDGELSTFYSDLDVIGGIQADNNVYAGGNLQTGGRVQIDNVKEYRESFTANGNSTLTFDVDIKSIGASGQPFEVFAGWTHYSTSYGCMYKAAYFQRSTIQSNITLVQTLINQSSLNAGFWSVSYVDANTIRITKNAGSHTSSGHGYIRVTHL